MQMVSDAGKKKPSAPSAVKIGAKTDVAANAKKGALEAQHVTTTLG
jgi:hypothetical protein